MVTGDISSLNSLAGQNNPRSVKMKGTVNGQEYLVLIDSGSTHNFVKPAVATSMRVPIEPTKPFHVYVGNGDALSCSKLCPRVAVVLQVI